MRRMQPHYIDRVALHGIGGRFGARRYPRSGLVSLLAACCFALSGCGDVQVMQCGVVKIVLVNEDNRDTGAVTIAVLTEPEADELDVDRLKLIAPDGTSYDVLGSTSGGESVPLLADFDDKTWAFFAVAPEHAQSGGWKVNYSGSLIAEFTEKLRDIDLED